MSIAQIPDPPLIEAGRLDGPVRVLAGPGAGKTHALVRLYADLVGAGVPRSRILVLTFSTSAAGEISRRIDELLRDSYDQAWISTFHGFCARLLRDHAPDPMRLLMSGFQEWMAMKAVLAEMDPARLGTLSRVRSSDAFAQDALAFVALLKQSLIHPARFSLLAEAGGSARMRALAAVFGEYQRRLESARLADFRDLVSGTIGLLESREELLESLRERFTHVLVDEFQDVDPAQFELVRMLAPPDRRPRLVVFGDPDQSIYGFRGTLPELLERDFERVYAARGIELDASRRCPPDVIAAGERLLEGTQPGRRPPRFRALSAASEGPSLDVAWEGDAVEEALRTARTIRAEILESEGALGPGDFAVLLRSTAAAAAPFEQALASMGLPYEVRGQGGLARNEVVRFLTFYLRSLARPEDAEALAEVLGSGLAGAGRRALSRLRAYAAEEGRPLGRVLNHLLFLLAERDPHRYPLPWGGLATTSAAQPEPPFLGFLTTSELDRLHAAVTTHQRLRARAVRLPLAALAYAVLEETGIVARLLAADLPEEERSRGLPELATAIAAFRDAEEVWRRLHGAAPLLADVAGDLESIVVRAVDESEAAPPSDSSAVQIMTVHQSKGLEFEVVFLSGFAEGVFPVRGRPHALLAEDEMAWMEANLPGFRPSWPGGAADHVAEEARLAYVAMTRARRHLHVTYAAEYGSATGPSPFLELAMPGAAHLPPELTGGPVEPGRALTLGEVEAAAARLGAPLDGAARQALEEAGCDLDFISDASLSEAFVPYLEGRPAGVAPHHFSATDLTAYLKCPRLYWYGHHPGLAPTPRSPEMTRGGFLHRVLEDFHSREVEWRALPPGGQKAWLEKALEAHLEGYLSHVEPVLDRRREELEVRKVLENYLRFATTPQKVPRRGTVATEKRFVLHLDGAEIHGVIDRINDTGGGTCEVVDYKTGRGMTARRAYEAYFGEHPYDVQLALYYLACREGVDEDGKPLDLEPRFLSLWYPKDLVWGSMRQVLFAVGDPAGLRPWMEQPLTEEDLERARGTVAEAVRKIRSGDFEPRPREAPGTCLAFTGCPHQAICPFARTAAE